MPVYFITGASRGLGLEYARQLLAQSRDNIIIATARTPGPPLTELKGLGTLHVLPCDVTDRRSIEACKVEVEKLTERIDYLFNNAGTIAGGYDNPTQTKADDLQENFTAHVVGQLQIIQVFAPLLKKGAIVVNVSSALGSCTLKLAGDFVTPYSIVKAAVNMLTVKQSVHYKDWIVIAMEPGHCQTDLGGKDAPLTAEEGVRGVLAVVRDLRPQDSGVFFDYKGERLPW